MPRSPFPVVPVLAVSALAGAAFLPPFPRAAADPVEVGWRDFDYGSAPGQRPTSEKPQSKLWWNDGIWWGCLWDPSEGAYRIHRMDLESHEWQSVGPNGDDRPDTLVDALWNGTILYVVSQDYDGSGNSRLYSYDYDPGSESWTLRSGFPVDVSDEGAEAITIEQDTTGKLWVTWEAGKRIWVNRSLGDDRVWGTPFELPVQGNDTSSDDISAIVAFDGKIGVMWSNQSDEANYFAIHLDGDPDTEWQPRETALEDGSAGQVADDHLDFATTPDPQDGVYCVSKTGLAGSSAPEIVLVRRDPSGTWTSWPVATNAVNWTRPTIQIDAENRVAYVFGMSDAIASDAIHVKTTDLDDIGFDTGPGELFIQSDGDDKINSPSSTKQCLTAATGMLVIASDGNTRHYFHNYLPLPTTLTSAPGSPRAPRPAVTLRTPGPNPWTGSGPATFRFELPGPATVALSLFDVAGRRVAARRPQPFDAGAHTLTWHPGRLPAGTYYLRLDTDRRGGAGTTWVVLR